MKRQSKVEEFSVPKSKSSKALLMNVIIKSCLSKSDATLWLILESNDRNVAANGKCPP